MITLEMSQEADMFANVLKKELEKAPKQTMALHPELTKEQMAFEMGTMNNADPKHPRNFFEHTKNSETANAFINSINDNTSTYRKKFEGMQDNSGKWQVQTANDLALRNMLNTHKSEFSRTSDLDERDSLVIKHQFEKSYFEAQEARYDYEKRPEKSEHTGRGVENLEDQAYKHYKEFKADKLKISPNQFVTTDKVTKPTIAPKEVVKPSNPTLSSVQERIFAMRQKNNVAQKPSMSRSVSM